MTTICPPAVDGGVPVAFQDERDRFEAGLAEGVIARHPHLGDFRGFGATHYAGLVMGA